MIIESTQLRKVIDLQQIPIGVYSGSITGFIATFTYNKEEYEVLLCKALSKEKKHCHVIKNKDGVIEIVITS